MVDRLSVTLLPIVASAFWAGILAWPLVAGAVSPGVGLAAGAAILLLSVSLAPWPAQGPGPLASAGLVPAEPEALRAVRPDRTVAGRAPPTVLCLAGAVGFLALGAGWAGIANERLAGSLLARTAPSTVEVQGQLGSDPEPGPFGWNATARLSELRVAGTATRTGEAVW